jgi:hypothetical protein
MLLCQWFLSPPTVAAGEKEKTLAIKAITFLNDVPTP